MKSRKKLTGFLAGILFAIYLVVTMLPVMAFAEEADVAAEPAAVPAEAPAPVTEEEAPATEEEAPAAEDEDPLTAEEEAPAEADAAQDAAEGEAPADAEEAAEQSASVEAAPVSEAEEPDADESASEEAPAADAEESTEAVDAAVASAGDAPAGSRITYVYNATLFNDGSQDYVGVYTTAITQNADSAETAKTSQTIGIESIADGNLPEPTTESPAIIQGAAVGYENRISATEYETIKERPEPYSEFRVKILEEQGADGTVHRKPSGFDGTYVIIRLDVQDFFSAGSDNVYLHMEQKDNKALMAAATVAKDVAGYVQPTNSFTDGLGNRSAAYNLKDLVDNPADLTGVPYLDVIVYATAANVAGADAGKADAPNGDIPLALYVDDKLQYNDALVDYDPTSVSQSTDPNAATQYDASWHKKFFDATRTDASHYLVKGSDLALETAVEKSDSTGEQTTYWSLKKSMEDPYYDQPIDSDPNDSGSGRTVKLMSEVAVTSGLTLQGKSENDLKKRTLDVNSYDIQVATNTGKEGEASESISLKDAWLTIADKSNTTGAEMAIGNNAQFVIDQGGKLIIDETCQLEIEWDGATTTPAADGSTPAQPDVLNNGQLDLRAGGEIINNGIITIEGTEGKPIQPGSGTEQQAIDSQKGSGEMTIRSGATLTNNGALVVYGKLTNEGTLNNNGRYNDVIKSNDPDKGAFDYHKGIQVAWKDDVTQKNIEAGTLTNGKGGVLVNHGDIVLTPGTLDNQGEMLNASGAHIYSAAATEAIIPITPDPATPTIVTKRIVLDPVKLSAITNSGTLTNNGTIAPATVALLDNTGAFDKLTSLGDHPELFSITNTGTLTNNGYIYGVARTVIAALVGSVQTANDTWLYFYDDGTFLAKFADGVNLNGTFHFEEEKLIFVLTDETVVEPETDENGDWLYRITTKSGYSVEFVLSVDFVTEVREKYENLPAA